MINLRIVRATENEISIIQKLETSARSKYYSTGITRKAIINYINNESIFLAYNQNNEVVGKISYKAKSNMIEISGLIILTKWRGLGYGKYLTNYILKSFPQSTNFMLTVHPQNLHAIQIYKNVGFAKIDKVLNMYGDSEPRLVMKLVKK